MEAVRLRPIGDDDQAFLLAVYGATRAQEVAQTGWDAQTAARFVRMQFDAQHAHYRQHHPHGTFDLVLYKDHPAGRLYVSRGAERIHVVDIALLPPYQNHGIGTTLMRQLMDEARRDGKHVTIHVEINNPALAWYQRLGFTEISSAGFHRLMRWEPDQATAPAAQPQSSNLGTTT